MSLACLPELHSPLYGHQLPSLIALSQEDAAIRAVPQLLQRGVAVHRPQRALPLLRRAALTVPRSPTVGHCEHSNIPPQINDLKPLCPALPCCYCVATQGFHSGNTEIKHEDVHPFTSSLHRFVMKGGGLPGTGQWKSDAATILPVALCLTYPKLSLGGRRGTGTPCEGKWIIVDM